MYTIQWADRPRIGPYVKWHVFRNEVTVQYVFARCDSMQRRLINTGRFRSSPRGGAPLTAPHGQYCDGGPTKFDPHGHGTTLAGTVCVSDCCGFPCAQQQVCGMRKQSPRWKIQTLAAEIPSRPLLFSGLGSLRTWLTRTVWIACRACECCCRHPRKEQAGKEAEFVCCAWSQLNVCLDEEAAQH